MSDITKCRGKDCPVRETCHRFTVQEGYWQSWFMDSPSKVVDGRFICNSYWGDNAQLIWDELKNKTNESKTD